MTIIKHDFQKSRQPESSKKKEEKAIPGLQLRVTLSYSLPSVWRTVQLPGTCTLADLHSVIQVCFGWDDSAGHRFLVGKIFYGPVAAGSPGGICSETDCQLHELEKYMGFIFSYLYDGGSGWECEIGLERLLPRARDIPQPVLIAANGASPPATITDAHEYQLLLASLEEAGLNREEILARYTLAGTFDPSYCDLRAMNDALHRIF